MSVHGHAWFMPQVTEMEGKGKNAIKERRHDEVDDKEGKHRGTRWILGTSGARKEGRRRRGC